MQTDARLQVDFEMLDHARYVPRVSPPHHIAPGQGKLDDSPVSEPPYWAIAS